MRTGTRVGYHLMVGNAGIRWLAGVPARGYGYHLVVGNAGTRWRVLDLYTSQTPINLLH